MYKKGIPGRAVPPSQRRTQHRNEVNMDAHIIGHRIKEARLAKKMTQAEVVGDFITRNMLSQIESGSALPSMKTLAYLASVLGIPLSVLMADEPEAEPPAAKPALSDHSPAAELATMKEWFHAKKYLALTDWLAEPEISDPLYDEKLAFLARASYEQALLLQASGDLPAALTFSKKASDYAGSGFYANASLKADALLLLTGLVEEISKTYTS